MLRFIQILILLSFSANAFSAFTAAKCYSKSSSSTAEELCQAEANRLAGLGYDSYCNVGCNAGGGEIGARLFYGTAECTPPQTWSNDPTKFNHRLHLVSQYNDNYGYVQTQHINIDVNAEDLTRVQEFCNINNGSQVIVQVNNTARKGGKSGAWLSQYMPKDAEIIVLQTKTQLDKAA